MHVRLIVLLLFIAAPLAAQQWRVFGRGAIFGIYSTETGPARARHQFFSTNWFEGHAERSFGRSSIEFHARLTAEPATVPDDGYPQLLQYVSARSGGPLADRMRGHDLVEDAGVRFWWRALRLDAAAVGTPPLGTLSIDPQRDDEEASGGPARPAALVEARAVARRAIQATAVR
jgi:hypothetical protein